MKRKSLLLLLVSALIGWVGSSDATAQDICFGPSIRVSDSTEMPRVGPSIAVDTCSNINVVWWDCRDGFESKDIYFSRSTDEGLTWSTSVKVNDEFPGNCINPSLDVDDSGNLYVAWEDHRNGSDIYFTTSSDSGGTWTHPNVRVNEHSTRGSYNPSLAVDDNGNIYVTWTDDRNGPSDIYFAKSTDGGSTWTTPNMKVNSPSTGYQLLSHVAVGDGGWVYAVWCDNRTGVWDGFFSMSKDSGRTWSPDVRVNDDDHRHVDDPRVAVGKDGAIYVVWKVGGIYLAKSTDDGETWTSPNIKVNSDSLDMIGYSQPCISVGDSEKVYVVWRARNGQDYTTHIYFAMSSDSGTTWTDPEMRVDDSLCIAGEYPSLDVDPLGNIYVAWDGSRITVHPVEIYFALGKPTNTIVTEALPNVIPKTFKLSQNYPNPFNPTTIIRYTIPDRDREGRPHRTTLKVYNILGQEIRKLVEEEQRPGFYTICWDGKDYNEKKMGSGIYFCRLQCGDFVATKKVVLLK